ncbi:MAG: preprotein translocase subunit SecY, partial [Clostridiales bacterium]|nr:preprotein translocase subunit SecY [Clostridiales bacterium]
MRTKILITLGILLLYRVGCWLPLPGLNPTFYQGDFDMNNGSFLSLISAIGGNALKNGAFLALGVSPYINASIIIQLLTIALPPLERLSKQGDDGRKKIAQITRYITLILGAAQCVGIIISWANSDAIQPGYAFGGPVWVTGLVIGVFMLAGTTFTMWLGEK